MTNGVVRAVTEEGKIKQLSVVQVTVVNVGKGLDLSAPRTAERHSVQLTATGSSTPFYTRGAFCPLQTSVKII